MSSNDDAPAVGQVTTQLHKSYRESLYARRQWIGVNGRIYDEELREELHGDLHETTMGWFEALHPYLRSNDSAEDYWTETKLWPTGVERQNVLMCPNCEVAYDASKANAGQRCANCDELIGYESLPVRDDDGQVVYEWETGLQSLLEWSDRTEVVTKTTGTFKPRTETEIVPLRIPPDRLLHVARLLDEAADELGLLATIDASTPRTELTEEMFEEVEQWRQRNLE